MKSLDLLRQLEEKLIANRQMERYCKDSIEWVRARKADWESDYIRVGVIGVTSSGKSTLVNSVLGADILSKAIVPTTGQLICCTYGDKETVTVRFEDGTSKVFDGDEFSKSNVTEFCDARYNQSNFRKVSDIEITSPRFALDKDVLLIDSPGMEAYGLETHDRLTLETLVPTMDVCIYVTTMKANNDNKTRAVLDVLSKYGCPVVIVQNMLDTVKASSDGEKSRKEVAAEQLERMKKLVDESDIDKKWVSIVQMSAEYARQYRVNENKADEASLSKFKESHYEEFIKYINSMIVSQRPRIEKARVDSVYGCVDSVKDKIIPYIQGQGSNSEFEYSNLMSEISQMEEKQVEEYKSVVQRFENASVNIRKGLSREDELQISLDKTNAQVKELGNGLLRIIERGNKLIEDASKIVNIPTRDLMKSMVFQSIDDITIKKRVIRTEKRMKDLGFGAALKRSIGFITGNTDLGYHTEVDKRYELDAEATKKTIENQLEVAYKRYTGMYADWKSSNFDAAVGTINKVVDLAREIYDIRKESTVHDMNLSALVEDMDELLNEWNSNQEILPDDEKVGDITIQDETETIMEGYETKFKETSKLEISDTVSSMVKLSKTVSKDMYNSLAKSLLKQVNCLEHTPVIVGWDEGCIKEFLWETGIKDAIVCGGNLNNDDVIKASKRCFFVLVNTIQFGAAKKQIMESEIMNAVTKDDYIVWVVQDFGELLTGDNLVEGLQNMIDFVKEQGYICEGCIWLCHDNPVYNLVFLEHQMDPVITYQREQEILRTCNEKYPGYLDEDVMRNIMKIIKDLKVDTK